MGLVSTYTGTVTVTDGLGRTASASGSATGTNASPTEQCPGQQNVPHGSTNDFDVTGSDPDDPENYLYCTGGVEQGNATVNSATCSSINVTACDIQNCYSTISFFVQDPWGVRTRCTFIVRGY